jgi:hypothetical protein
MLPSLPAAVEGLVIAYVTPGYAFALREIYPRDCTLITEVGDLTAEEALRDLAEEGLVGVITWLIEGLPVQYCRDYWSQVLLGAASGGHSAIMVLADARGVCSWYWNGALRNAAEKGHVEAMRLCGESGANGWDRALPVAANGGHWSAVKLCDEKGATEWDQALNHAAAGGHERIMLLCEEKGATEWATASSCAAANGHVEIVRLCGRKGAKYWERDLEYAIAVRARMTAQMEKPENASVS